MNDTVTIPSESYYTITRAFVSPNISIYDQESRFKYDFKPSEDITTLELAYLMQLFVCLSAGSGYNIAVSKYIDEQNLNRHFLCTPQ
jgi:hypothetical protein